MKIILQIELPLQSNTTTITSMNNEHKVVCANAHGFIVYFTDTEKHWFYHYSPQSLSKYARRQLTGKYRQIKKYPKREPVEFSPYQNRLYNDAVYGLRSYSLFQIRSMSWFEKKMIIETHQVAKKHLDVYKKKIICKEVDGFFASWLPFKNPIRQIFEKANGHSDIDLFSDFNLEELNFTNWDIANILIRAGILPATFFLKTAA
jgi:hypothetical protein